MSFSLKEELVKHGIPVTERQLEQFNLYYDMLIDWNERMNLTAITDRDGVMEKHFFDSVTPALFEDFNQIREIADIGAGAGFPSIPIKILFPHLNVTIVDSLNKRITFLNELCRHLGLNGVSCIHGRAEEVATKKEWRESFSFVMARAVARLPVLLELCLPFVKIGGTFLGLKGSNGLEEKQESETAVNVLGGKWERIETLQLPSEQSQRTLIWVKKIKATPKQYPRKPGTPNKNPIK
jgi:16S rRNA (guanine527-N7)-methyltransferase